MTRETGYFVQSFNSGKGGSLKAPLVAGYEAKEPKMSDRLETLKRARERMIEDRDTHAKVLAAPFDRDRAERARSKFTEI